MAPAMARMSLPLVLRLASCPLATRSAPRRLGPPVRQPQLAPPRPDRLKRPARPLRDFLRWQRSYQFILPFRPGRALGRAGAAQPVRLAHLLARLRGVVRAPVRRRHGRDDLGGPALAPLGRSDLRAADGVTSLRMCLRPRLCRPRLKGVVVAESVRTLVDQAHARVIMQAYYRLMATATRKLPAADMLRVSSDRGQRMAFAQPPQERPWTFWPALRLRPGFHPGGRQPS